MTGEKSGRNWMVPIQPEITTLITRALTAIIILLALAFSAQAQTFTVLYTFTGNADGAFPSVTPVLDSSGNVYGGTDENSQLTCKKFCGNVFEVTPAGVETTLYTFNGGIHGYGPSGLAFNKAGTLYGTTGFGGPGAYGLLFKVRATNKITVLHHFPAQAGDGELPGYIFFDPTSNLYGVAGQGGTGCNGYGCGTVFKFDKHNKETSIDLSESAWAPSGLVRDAAGNLYGTTINGGGIGCGGIGCGTVFKIDTSGNLTVLYAFQGAPDGSIPEGSLALDSAGNLYGTTWEGGDSQICPQSGCGTVYKIDFSTGKETVLHVFKIADGLFPTGGVIIDPSGNLYGTTFGGGTAPSCQGAGCGTVFKIDTKGNETVLYSFGSLADGGFPIAGLVMDKQGNLYGTALYGGYAGGSGLCFPSGCGTVFKLTP